MLGPYQISVILAIILIALAIIRDRKNWNFGIVSMRRSQRGINFIHRAVKRFPGLVKGLGYLSIIVCACLLAYGVFLVFFGLYLTLAGLVTGPTGGILLPNINNEVVGGTGFILIPFWYWILAIPLIMIPHEFMHGIFAAQEKIRIKSVGLILLAFIVPGAFVEPDDVEMNKKRTLARIKVACGGSFANFLVGLLFLLIMSAAWSSTVSPIGVEVTNVTEGSPAWQAGLREEMVITSLNDVEANTFPMIGIPFNVGLAIPEININDSIKYTLEDGTVLNGVIGEHPEIEGKGYLGIRNFRPATDNDWGYLYQWFNFLNWIIILQIWIGIFNILPIYPLDGGLVVRYLTERRTRNWKKIVYPITFFFVFVFLVIIFGPSVMGLF